MKLWLNVRQGAEYAAVYRDTVYAAWSVARCDTRASVRDRGTADRTSSSESLEPEATS
jgi:hypothetical protein